MFPEGFIRRIHDKKPSGKPRIPYNDEVEEAGKTFLHKQLSLEDGFGLTRNFDSVSVKRYFKDSLSS